MALNTKDRHCRRYSWQGIMLDSEFLHFSSARTDRRRPTESRGGQMKYIAALQGCAAVFVWIATAPLALAQNHPDEGRYEYAVKNHQGREPPANERIYWECWDDKAKMSISCTFIRGSLKGFRHVFRDRVYRPKFDNNCDFLDIEAIKVIYDEGRVWARWNPDTDYCAEAVTDKLKLLTAFRKVDVESRRMANKCTRYDDSLRVARRDVTLLERSIKLNTDLCESDRRQAGRVRAIERREAEREAREAKRSSDATTSSLEGSAEYGPMHMERIQCFGGCQPLAISRLGPFSTITSSAWGDKAPPERPGSVRPAR